MSFPEIGLCHDTEFVKYFVLINVLFWMTFPVIGLAHDPILKKN